MPFKKGQSGNPGGRPKAEREVLALAREYAPAAIDRLFYWMGTDNAKASVSACNAILDRAYGKPTQPISGDDEKGPLEIVTRDYSRLSKAERENLRELLSKAAAGA